MNSLTAIKRASLAMVALSAMGVSQSVLAAGTDSGTTISNTASVTYSVNSITQPVVNSTTASFVVDQKIDISVSGSNVVTQPNATNVYMPFTVANEGNATDTFTLSIQSIAGDFVPAGAYIWVDANNNNTIDSGEAGSGTGTAATNTVTLTKDGTAVVRIVAPIIPGTATNGQVSNLTLRATTTTAQTTGVDTAGVDVVWADGTDFNGYEQDTKQYSVQAAAVSVNKTATLISDPVNGTGANRKAIPGAVVQYSITVSNATTASLPATGITIGDTLPSTVTYRTGTIGKTGGTAAAPTDANVVSGVISVSVGTLAAGESATVTFQVDIN